MQLLPSSLQQQACLNSFSYPFCDRLVGKLSSSLSPLSMAATAAKATACPLVFVAVQSVVVVQSVVIVSFSQSNGDDDHNDNNNNNDKPDSTVVVGQLSSSMHVFKSKLLFLPLSYHLSPPTTLHQPLLHIPSHCSNPHAMEHVFHVLMQVWPCVFAFRIVASAFVDEEHHHHCHHNHCHCLIPSSFPSVPPLLA